MKSRLSSETELVLCWYVQTVADRLHVLPDVETDAVLSVDDDVDLVTDEVSCVNR